LVLLCTVEESRSLPLYIWWVRLKERFANKISGVDDTHCGWDRELLVGSTFQHWRIIFQVTSKARFMESTGGDALSRHRKARLSMASAASSKQFSIFFVTFFFFF
jgi:hypothetical protein